MSEDYKLFKDDYDIKRKIDDVKFDFIKDRPSISDLQSYKNGEIKYFRYSDDSGVIRDEAVIRIDDRLYKINLTLLEE